MDSLSSRNLSFQKQNLILEFVSICHALPEGIYVTIAPGDSSRWNGVIFVRKGPYAGAILRFKILFPPTYPALPPLVTFAIDLFHPLVTPSTTYTYINASHSSDSETLPPGSFSLKHKFPYWFSRQRKKSANSPDVNQSLHANGLQSNEDKTTKGSEVHDSVAPRLLNISHSSFPLSVDVPVLDILKYIQLAFSDDEIIDSIPLDAAANPGAYHAWKAYRAGSTTLEPKIFSSFDLIHKAPGKATPVRCRKPEEWDWKNVWEDRVRKAVQLSISKTSLYGNAGNDDDLIRFQQLDKRDEERAKKSIEELYSSFVV